MELISTELWLIGLGEQISLQERGVLARSLVKKEKRSKLESIGNVEPTTRGAEEEPGTIGEPRVEEEEEQREALRLEEGRLPINLMVLASRNGQDLAEKR